MFSVELSFSFMNLSFSFVKGLSSLGLSEIVSHLSLFEEFYETISELVLGDLLVSVSVKLSEDL